MRALPWFGILLPVAFVGLFALAQTPDTPHARPRSSSELETLLEIARPAERPQADHPRYRLVEVPTREIDKHMPIADGSNGIPEALQGLWWMDGNPLADEVVSFGASTWDPASRTTRIQVYGERVWSWHPNAQGRALYFGVRNSKLVYELQCNEDITFCLIVPIVDVGEKEVRVPTSLVKFTARLISDGVWLRETSFFGREAHTYAFRRIVRGNGEREPAFEEFVRSAQPTQLLAERVD